MQNPWWLDHARNHAEGDREPWPDISDQLHSSTIRAQNHTRDLATAKMRRHNVLRCKGRKPSWLLVINPTHIVHEDLYPRWAPGARPSFVSVATERVAGGHDGKQ